MTEKKLHEQICTYLKLQYPNVVFNTDLSGIKLTIGQAKQLKKVRSSKGFPDIFIYEPKFKYAGLFLEVKKESPFKKDGELKTDTHLKEQFYFHEKLHLKGYFGGFVWTFEGAKELIDKYLTAQKYEI